jgi:hypothetical protein
MRCKKLIAILLAAVFLLGTTVSAKENNARHKKVIVDIDGVCNDHPWQDESVSGGGKSVMRPLLFAIGPFAFTINIAIPSTHEPLQAPAMPSNNTATQKNVEKGK